MSHLIQTAILTCSIPQFRARMDRLDNLLGAKSWSSSDDVRLVFGEFPYTKWSYESIKTNNFVPMGMYIKTNDANYESTTSENKLSTRASWSVVPWRSTSMRPWYDSQGFYFAGLELYEEAEKQVRIDFLDGYNPEHPKKDFHQIGTPFEEFTQMLLQELKGVTILDRSTEDHTSRELFHILSERFNGEELKTFCFSLDVDYENLPAEGKENKARELLLFFKRRNQVSIISEKGKQLRPEIDWPII